MGDTRMRGKAAGLAGPIVGASALIAAVALLAAVLLSPDPALASAGPDDGDTFMVDGIVYEVTEPASGTSASEAGMVTIADGSGYGRAELVVGTVEYADDGATFFYDVTCVGTGAFEGDETLERVEFECDLLGPYYEEDSTYGGNLAIMASAFEGCTSLEEVVFPEKVAGIGERAFYGCSSLVDVEFPEDAELYVTLTTNTTAIGTSAFAYCTALEEVSIPAITSTTRFADWYYTYDEYNPDSNQRFGINTTSYVYSSAYQSYWHSGAAPTRRAGISGSAFSGCTSLRSVVFEAGSSLGCYAYFNIGADAFSDCTALESLVFETDQAYAVDPNGSMHNATYDCFFDDDAEVDLYYAVDYYATEEEVESDDDSGSGRLARTEYLRGTSVSGIASGDADSVSASVYDPEAYAEDGYADGEVLDPDEAAIEAFGESAADTEWAWKLTDSQSQREGLTDSCAAYLVEASDISAGSLQTEVMESLQKRCDQNFSRWIVDGEEQDSTFDAYRYFNDDDYDFTSEDSSEDPADDLFVVVSSEGEESFLSQIAVLGASGEELDRDDYTVSYQRYDGEEGELLDAEDFESAIAVLGRTGGPILLSIVPTDGSGYTGELQVWVLVKANEGSVLERYSSSSSGSVGDYPTWYLATLKSEVSGSGSDVYTGPYAVMVGSGDLSSALVATAFAGLAEAPINVDDSDEEDYGFYLGTSFSARTGALSSTSSSDGQTFSASGRDEAGFAVASYEAFESDSSSNPRSKLGVSSDEYQWGDTALLVDLGSLEEVSGAASAYAYAAEAPVFYASDDGSVDDDTLECLGDFEEVLLLGSSDAFDEDAIEAIGSSLEGVDVDAALVSGTLNASLLSREVADLLMEEGLADVSTVTVSDATDPFDAIGALNRSGESGGISLVCAGTAEAKQTCAYLRNLRDGISTVRLFGRTDGSVLAGTFNMADILEELWDEQGGYEEPEISDGDTVELSGIAFCISGGSGTGDDPFEIAFSERLWGEAGVDRGTYEVDGVLFELSESASALDDDGSSDGAADGDADASDDASSDGNESGSDSGTSQSGSSSQGGSSSSSGSTTSSPQSGSSGSEDGSGSGSSSQSGTLAGLSSSPSSSATLASSSSGTSSSGSGSAALASSSSDGGDGASALVDTSDDASDDGSYVDNGWEVENVGAVTEVASVDVEYGDSNSISSSASSSGDDVSPIVIGIAIAAGIAMLCCIVWMVTRRRAGGFDDEINGC